MSISKKIRKAKMARKQKERQEKANNILKRKLNEALEDPANRKIIELVREVMSDEDLDYYYINSQGKRVYIAYTNGQPFEWVEDDKQI
jgi:hypothetical protein